jgi:large subunit ribosomal protein L31
MKKGIHPEYREVVFQDTSINHAFLTRSTVKTDKKIMFEGKEYPLVQIEISNLSHPFFTGTQRMIDTAGRVEKFNQRYKRGK